MSRSSIDQERRRNLETSWSLSSLLFTSRRSFWMPTRKGDHSSSPTSFIQLYNKRNQLVFPSSPNSQISIPSNHNASLLSDVKNCGISSSRSVRFPIPIARTLHAFAQANPNKRLENPPYQSSYMHIPASIIQDPQNKSLSMKDKQSPSTIFHASL